MLTPEENLVYEYLIDQAINGELPPQSNYRPKREELDAAPEDVKRYMINLILGYQKNNPLMQKILKDYQNKYDDRSFGMRIKEYIKELLL